MLVTQCFTCNRCSGIFFSLMCLLTVKEKPSLGTFPEVQWLKFCASNAWDSGLIPGQRNKIPHAWQGGQKKKKNPSPLPGEKRPLSHWLVWRCQGTTGNSLELNWFSSVASTLLPVHRLLITLLDVCVNPAFCLLWICKFCFQSTHTNKRGKDCKCLIQLLLPQLGKYLGSKLISCDITQVP